MAKPRPDIVAAMELLLTRQQIAYILGQTWSGRDRVEILKRLVNVGIATLERERAAADRMTISHANQSAPDCARGTQQHAAANAQCSVE